MATQASKGNQGAGPNKGSNAGSRQKRKNRQTQRSQQYTQMAGNNVALQDQPQADMLGTLNQQTQADQLRQRNAAESVYGGGLQALKDVTPTNYEGIRGQMNNALSTLAPDFGGQAYQAPGEGQAGNALGLAYGEAGNSMLSNMQAREGAHQASSERQMGLQGVYAGDRINQDMTDSLQQYRNQLQNLRANDPYQIQQEATRLEDQAMSNKLGMSQVKSDAAFSKYLQDMLGNQLGGNGGGGGPGGGGPSGNGNGNGQGNDNGSGGGNPNPPPTGHTGPGATYGGPHGGGGGGTPQIPAAWQRAENYNQLPQILRESYTRPKGTSLEEVFGSTAHPSFQNFNRFEDAYDAFRRYITQLYNQGPGSAYGQGNGGIPGRL